MAIGQALHAEDALIVGEHFSQPVFCVLIRGDPAVAFAVGKIAVCGQSLVVGADRISVTLEHIGDGLAFAGEIVLEDGVIVVVLAVGGQDAGGIVAAVRVLLKPGRLAQLGDAVNRKARTFQLQCRGRLAGGGNQLIQGKAGFQHFVLAFLFGLDVVGGLVRVGQGFIMVDLIAKIAFSVGKVVTIPGFAAVQSAAFGYSRILIFIDVVTVFSVLGSKVSVLVGALQLFIKERIFAGGVQFAVAINGQNQAGGAFDQVVAAHVEVGKSEFGVLDLGGSNKAVFLEDGQIVGIPAAVGEDGGVPDGLAVGIRDFAVVNDAGDPIRVLNGLGSVQVIHSAFERGIAVAACRQVPGGIQIDLVQHNAAKDTVILELVGTSVHGVGIFIIGDAGGVSNIGFVCDAVAKGNADDALVGVDEGASVIGCADVSVVVSVAQLNGFAVQIFRDLDGIGPFTKNRTSGAGCSHIRPVTVVPAGGTALGNDKSALVALSVINVVGAVCIIAIVDDLIGAIRLALNFVLVIPARGDVALQNRIPFKNCKFCVSANPLLGLTVDLVDDDFH